MVSITGSAINQSLSSGSHITLVGMVIRMLYTVIDNISQKYIHQRRTLTVEIERLQDNNIDILKTRNLTYNYSTKYPVTRLYVTPEIWCIIRCYIAPQLKRMKNTGKYKVRMQKNIFIYRCGVLL